jgi:hypothetical protein
MATKSSRRELLCASAIAVVGTVVAKSASAQETAPTDPGVETIVANIEKQMAKPLSDDAKKLLPGAVKNSLTMRADRLKFKLPENSEPCTVYVPGSGK